MSTVITFMAVKEVERILARLPRTVRQKINNSMAMPSLYKRISARSPGYAQAPAMPCHCAEGSKRYGIAIRFAGTTPVETMLFCPSCQGIFVKPFDAHPFIGEGINDHENTEKRNKTNEPVLG